MSSPGSSVAEGLSRDYVALLIGADRLDALLARVAPQPVAAGRAERLDYVTAWKVVHAAVEAEGDEGHRLAGTTVPNGNFELLIASMMQGRTLADGLRRMSDGARILRPDLAVEVAVRARRRRLTIRFRKGESRAQAIYLEALVTVLHCAICWGLARPARAQSVRGSAAVAAGEASWLDLMADRVQRRGSGVSVVYGEDLAEAPFQPHDFARWHDAAFHEYLRLVEERREAAGVGPAAPPGEGAVSRAVRRALLDAVGGQDEIARSLGMSVATLRRRLAEEGASFRLLQSGLRRDAAEVLLLSERPVEDIAAELGLSDSRCFRRACRAWFGASPSSVRRALRARDPGAAPSR